MCGIAGVAWTSDCEPVADEIVWRMTDILAHRGPDDSAIYSGLNLAPHGQNAMFWTNAAATNAMADALKTIDQARRKRDYEIVQQQLALDVPTIILYFQRFPFVYNTDLKNFDPSPVISGFWDTWNYSI